MLHGTLWDKIPRFAVPVAATAILSQLFNAADIAVIGNFTGELRTVAVAAVGANSALIALIVNLFIGIALGANVTIAHAIGEKNDTMVHHAVHTSIVVAVLGGLIAAVIGELFAVPLLNQLNVPDDVFPLALLYLRIYLAGLPVILLYNFEAAVFRSVGETKIPLIALTASGVLNVIQVHSQIQLIHGIHIQSGSTRFICLVFERHGRDIGTHLENGSSQHRRDILRAELARRIETSRNHTIQKGALLCDSQSCME